MKKLLVGGAVIALAIGGYKWKTSSHHDDTVEAADGKGSKIVFDRFWIDHIPRDERDPIKIFVALTQEPVGIFQTTTMWTGQYEIFQYEAKGGELRAVFPQNRDSETITAKGSKCDENSMDFCLELKGSSRGVSKYYSMKGWELDGLDEAAAKTQIDAKISSLVHGATHV